MSTRMVVGCMTGTSIDGIDAALVRIEGAGLDMQAAFVRGVSSSLGKLAPRLRAIAEQKPQTAGDIAALSREFSLAHARAVRQLLGNKTCDLICVHGQTVFHQPPVSWQLFNPWPLVWELRTPVVFDLRGADIAAGGQGAPITPLADWVLFRTRAGARTIVNLGGFCNYTAIQSAPHGLPGDEVEGGDVCGCNLLLDAIARQLLGTAFDEGGKAAAQGTVHRQAAEDLRNVLLTQSGSRRSLGTGDEVLEWLSRWRAGVQPKDMAATACEMLGQVLARRLEGTGEIFLAGGGAHNATLAAAIARWSAAPVKPLNALGVPVGFREAAEFAVLGAICQDRMPITLPRVTGVPDPAPVAGCWAYP